MADPGPNAAGTGESMNSQLQAITQNMPALTAASSSSILPLAQAQQAAQNVTAPQQAALNTSLYQQYAPQLAATGNQITAQNAAANANLVAGAGGQAALNAETLQKQLDPEYYATRAAAGSQIQNLLGQFNLNGGLSGSETAAVERSNAQQDASRGINNTPSQTATVSNAMNFGSALAGKQQRLEQALGTATSFLPSSQGAINGFQTATGAPTNSGSITPTTFGQGTASQASGDANTLATSILGAANSTANNSQNINANRNSALTNIINDTSKITSAVS